tara:strand:- start:324 stop:482 length:159 start_codon:yes stop_codon:yes gene_type:complete
MLAGKFGLIISKASLLVDLTGIQSLCLLFTFQPSQSSALQFRIATENSPIFY